MFTGIIQEIGTVASVGRLRGLVRVDIAAPKLAPQTQQLDSIAVNGVCLSVVRVRQELLTFELIPETQRLSNLQKLRRGNRVNLEPSLSICDRLHGHFLFGHVDGLGVVIARRQLTGELVLTIRVAAGLRKFLVPKGPVAVDGVSLTLGKDISSLTFSVHLIPETLRQTTLGARRVGDRVNIELDYLAKLIWQLLKSPSPYSQPF